MNLKTQEKLSSIDSGRFQNFNKSDFYIVNIVVYIFPRVINYYVIANQKRGFILKPRLSDEPNVFQEETSPMFQNPILPSLEKCSTPMEIQESGPFQYIKT